MIRINFLKPSCKRSLRMRQRLKTGVVAVIITLAVHGSARIIDGAKVEAKDFPQVFALITSKLKADGNRGPGICTATLVHERLLLTAAHCVDGVKNIPQKAVNGVNAYGEDRGIRVEVESYGVHKDWLQEGQQEFSRYLQEANDVGYVVLKEPVENVTPMSLYLAEDFQQIEKLVGMPLTLVGYGLRTAAAPPVFARGIIGIKTSSEGKIAGVDHGRIYRTGLKGNTASGDSGGPAISTLFGKKLLVGVIATATLESTTDETRFGFFAPLRRPHLCWIQDETQFDLGVRGCGAEDTFADF